MPVVTTKAPKTVNPNVDPNTAQEQAPGTPAPAPSPQAPNLPYAQPNQLLNVVKPVQPATNNSVLQTAQQSAVDAQNKPNETMGLVQSGVQDILKNPLGYDKDKYVNNQLEQYDRNRSNAMSAFQQSNADTSNTGLNLEKAYNYAMQGAQGRSDLENTQRMEQATKEREAMLSALGMGNQTVQNQSALDEAAFNRLSTARSMAEGERSQAQGQENAKELQTLEHTQNLETLGVQKDISKDLMSVGFDQDTQKMAIANGYDINKLIQTYGLEGAKQKVQNDFTKELTNITQSWQTSERLDEQSFSKQTQAIQIAAAAAEKDKDIDTQKYLQSESAKLQLKMQTQDMDQQEKMAYINGEIATAKANGDVGRQKDLVSFQTGQELETMAAQSGIDQAKIQLQGNIQKAIAQGDHEAAAAMQETGFTFQAWENQKDRAIKEAEVDNTIVQAAIANGTIDPKASPDIINKALKNIGITVSMPDQMATQKEMATQFKETQQQWGMSHPEALVDPSDPTKGLNDAGAKSFNEFYNTTLYNDQDFGSSEYKPIAWSGDASPTNDKAFATTPPAVGQFIRYRGTTMKVTSDVTADQTTAGGGLLQFTAVDTKTGQTHTIKAGNEGN
jgi:hypothetical protein